MNVLDIKCRWNIVKAQLKQRYTMLSDDDLVLRFGREGDLIDRLQKKLGKSKADVLKLIEEA
jgi:hypothetical protein